ncbi:MAG: conserved phage C-terminal domain-containing protein [Streptococcaceae bacterium]|jgi:uncharacterized phage protein (TIGR02220 family)|nr:conserved phage C-terminal domain-containing protein [Streptococcaceae bacterium]
MAILKKRTRNEFTQIANAAAKDKDLSWKARGILLYLMSLPDSWEIYLEEISKHSNSDGYTAFRSGIKELENLGYFKTTKKHENGKLVWVHEVTDEKNYFRLSTSDFQQLNFNNRKSPTINKDQQKKTNKEIEHKESVALFISYLNEKSGKKYNPETKSYIQAVNKQLKNGYTVEQMKSVVDLKAKEWLNTDMAKHLNPITLLRESNFDRYLNEVPSNRPKRVSNPDMKKPKQEDFEDEYGFFDGEAFVKAQQEYKRAVNS